MPADDTDKATAGNATEEPVRSAADLRMEAMEKRMEEMERAHAAQIAELTEANRGLWAALHPVEQEQTAEPAPEPGATAYRVLADKLGLAKEE